MAQGDFTNEPKANAEGRVWTPPAPSTSFASSTSRCVCSSKRPLVMHCTFLRCAALRAWFSMPPACALTPGHPLMQVAVVAEVDTGAMLLRIGRVSEGGAQHVRT